ncbi:hypothetical protein [Kribbella sp. NPDC051620]|uniref:hypothetical protein n=1 Tax=Kribbella sp. NPDC051620 TaxID=3364120 RepID=UPI00379AFA39
MTGVLAGFAFAAITLVLQGAHRRASAASRDVDDVVDVHVLVSLTCAFLSLLISTLAYSVVGGERSCSLVQGRAASEEFLGGITFAFAIFCLLYSIVHLVSHAGVPRVVPHVRAIIIIVGPPLTILFLSTAALDVASTPWKLEDGNYLPRVSGFSDALLVAEWALPLCVLVLCSLMWRMGSTRRRSAGSAEASSRWISRWTIYPYTCLGLTIVAEVRAAFLPVTDPGASISPWQVWAGLILCTVVLVAQSASLSFEAGVDQAKQSAPEQPSAGPDPVEGGPGSGEATKSRV